MSKSKGVTGLIPLTATAVAVPIDIAEAHAAPAGTYQKRIPGTAQIALQFQVAGADAAPTATIYGSNTPDGPWDAYAINGDGDTGFNLPVNDSLSITRDSFPHEYISVGINKNAGTEGMMVCKINIKEQTI